MSSKVSPNRHSSNRLGWSATVVKNWISQIVIGIIIAVVGTVIADSIMRGFGHRGFLGGIHFSGSSRSGR
jgi:hypothetical protein